MRTFPLRKERSESLLYRRILEFLTLKVGKLRPTAPAVARGGITDRNYPVILGTKRNGLPTKVGLGMKSKLGSGYDFMILGLHDDHPDVNTCTKKELGNALDGRLYATLHFSTLESLDTTIRCLQNTKKLWEAELEEENAYERSKRI